MIYSHCCVLNVSKFVAHQGTLSLARISMHQAYKVYARLCQVGSCMNFILRLQKSNLNGYPFLRKWNICCFQGNEETPSRGFPKWQGLKETFKMASNANELRCDSCFSPFCSCPCEGQMKSVEQEKGNI